MHALAHSLCAQTFRAVISRVFLPFGVFSAPDFGSNAGASTTYCIKCSSSQVQIVQVLTLVSFLHPILDVYPYTKFQLYKDKICQKANVRITYIDEFSHSPQAVDSNLNKFASKSQDFFSNFWPLLLKSRANCPVIPLKRTVMGNLRVRGMQKIYL